MRLNNPFTPSFGGSPEYFVGRSELIGRVGRALENDQSPDRALFITGSRGSGKTALLERLSMLAHDARWLSIDVHSSHAVSSILEALEDAETVGAVEASPSISLPGGIDVSVGRARTGKSPSSTSLSRSLVRRCSSLAIHRGVFITIDEVQKISEDDIEEVCSAVQMVRRKGLPIALMLAGLPGTKEKVASYRGCTFMQRVVDCRIAGLRISETVQAFTELMALSGIDVDKDVVWRLANMSQGYPYLVQLVGYHFVEHMDTTYPLGLPQPTPGDVDAIEETVYQQYRHNVLVPSTRDLGSEMRAYLQAMSGLLDAEGYARTGDVARTLGKEQKQLSSCRQSLMDRRLILSGGYGKVSYGLPYLSRFSRERDVESYEDMSDRWVPR